MSRRKAAGSKRNKKHKFVGTRTRDCRQENNRRNYYPDPTWKKSPDHKARAVSIDTVVAQMTGGTIAAAAHSEDKSIGQRVKLVSTRLFRVKNSG